MRSPFADDYRFSHEQALPFLFLRTPAESALISLLVLRVQPAPYRERIPQEHLSEDAKLVLEACQALQRSRDQDNTPIDEGILSASAKTLVESLSDTTLQKLSLITWHFDASGAPSEGLRCFLRQPSDDTVWKTVHGRYQMITKQDVPFREFRASHDFLLCPALGSASNGV